MAPGAPAVLERYYFGRNNMKQFDSNEFSKFFDEVATTGKLTLNGVKFIREDLILTEDGEPIPQLGRAVVVVDRGWIFAGDVTVKDGFIHLDRAVWVFRWESIGFDGVIENPKDKKVTLKPMKNRVTIPVGAEIFRVPVAKDWGL